MQVSLIPSPDGVMAPLWALRWPTCSPSAPCSAHLATRDTPAPPRCLGGQPGFCSRCPQSSQHPHALDSMGLCHLTVTVLSKHRASAPERQAPLSAAAGEEGGHTNTPMERLHSGERYVVICFCLTKKKPIILFFSIKSSDFSYILQVVRLSSLFNTRAFSSAPKRDPFP